VETSNSTAHIPRRLVVSAGVPAAQLPESATTMTSAAQALPIGLEEIAEARAAGLFLAFEEESHTDAEAVGQQPQSREVDHDAGLVVGGSAAEETIALAGGDEGFGVPVLGASGRLDVVMGVEEDGRGAFGSRHGGDDGRVSVRCRQAASAVRISTSRPS
jgi:hypothetical protein